MVLCPQKSCNDDYVGETPRRTSERVIDHGGRNKNSHILKHQNEKNTFLQNTRFLKLLVVFFVITLRRENDQKRYGLALLDFP